MPADLHLFSSPGENDIRYIVDACRPYLESRDDATVAYLPLASLYAERWLEQIGEIFRGLGRIETINAELMTQAEIENLIRRATVLFIPGGNTFLLSHRLHTSGVMPYLRKKVQSGLPVAAFSAGTILCGPNILTSKDLNTVATSQFDGLNACPYNFLTHYSPAPYGLSPHDEWLADYHVFHDNPVIMMCDGAYIQSDGRKTRLIRGEAWILRKDEEKERLQPGLIGEPPLEQPIRRGKKKT